MLWIVIKVPTLNYSLIKAILSHAHRFERQLLLIHKLRAKSRPVPGSVPGTIFGYLGLKDTEWYSIKWYIKRTKYNQNNHDGNDNDTYCDRLQFFELRYLAIMTTTIQNIFSTTTILLPKLAYSSMIIKMGLSMSMLHNVLTCIIIHNDNHSDMIWYFMIWYDEWLFYSLSLISIIVHHVFHPNHYQWWIFIMNNHDYYSFYNHESIMSLHY